MRRRPRPLPRVEADPGQPLVLALDTATSMECMALVQGELVLTELRWRRPRGKGSELAHTVAELLARVERAPEDLDAVAVGVGPGAFTGVRVGVAAATGLAAGLAVPAVGFDSLLPWAHAARPGRVCVAADARRSEVYTAQWLCDEDGALHALEPVRLQEAEGWLALLAECPESMQLIGDGATLYADRARQVLGPRAHLPAVGGPELGSVARSIARRIAAGQPAGPEPRPLYLRKHDGSRA